MVEGCFPSGDVTDIESRELSLSSVASSHSACWSVADLASAVVASSLELSSFESSSIVRSVAGGITSSLTWGRTSPSQSSSAGKI